LSKNKYLDEGESFFDKSCKLFAKKLRSILKKPSYQKSINLIDYIIEGKDDNYKVNLLYPVTVSLIIKRFENNYYRRLDSALFDLRYFNDNLTFFQEELAAAAQEHVVYIKTAIKKHFK
jgi:hypothetical protein